MSKLLSVIIPGRNEEFMRHTVEDVLIYVITNTITGKQYAGQTRCGLVERWRKHWRRAEANKGACRALAAAIRKYGKDAFTIEAIRELPADATQEQIDAAERDAISELGTLSPGGYNLIGGGKGGRPSAETLARRSAALKGRPLTQEHRQKLSEAQRGRRRTSAAEIAGNKKRAEERRGKPRSPEAIAKMVKSQRARSELPRTEAQKAAAQRHSEFMSNRKASPETRSRTSDSMKAYHQRRTEALYGS